MGLTLGVFGQQQAYMPARQRNVSVNDNNLHIVGSVKVGQRCELIVKANPGSPSQAIALVNGGISNPDYIPQNGGRILSEAVGPMEIYSPERGSLVAVRKWDVTTPGPHFEAHLYPVDGSQEPGGIPPLLVDQQQACSLPALVTGITSPNLGAPAVAGDLLLAWVAAPVAATAAPVGVGWTYGGVIQAGADPTVTLWYKVAAGGELAETWQDLASPAGPWAVALMQIRKDGAAALKDYALDYPQTPLGMNGGTDPFSFGIYSGRIGKMAPDARFALFDAPMLQVGCFANYGGPYPGTHEVFQFAFPSSLEQVVRFGGGDVLSNPMLCATAVLVTRPAAIEWQAINLDPAMFGTPYPFQAGTISLAGIGS